MLCMYYINMYMFLNVQSYNIRFIWQNKWLWINEISISCEVAVVKSLSCSLAVNTPFLITLIRVVFKKND